MDSTAPTPDGVVQQLWQMLLDAGVVHDANDKPLIGATITVDHATITLEVDRQLWVWNRPKAPPLDPAIAFFAQVLVATLDEPAENPPGQYPRG